MDNQFNFAKIKTVVDGSTIFQATNLAGHISQRVIHTEEKQIKESLIALGWQPPSNEIKPMRRLNDAVVEVLSGIDAERLEMVSRLILGYPWLSSTANIKLDPSIQSVEQQARDLLERLDVKDAQSYSAGEIVELANLISKYNYQKIKMQEMRESLALVEKQLEDFKLGLAGEYKEEYETIRDAVITLANAVNFDIESINPDAAEPYLCAQFLLQLASQHVAVNENKPKKLADLVNEKLESNPLDTAALRELALKMIEQGHDYMLINCDNHYREKLVEWAKSEGLGVTSYMFSAVAITWGSPILISCPSHGTIEGGKLKLLSPQKS